MLQILTGRFFEGKLPVNEQSMDAVLFSNLGYPGNLTLPVGELRASWYARGDSSAFVFRYPNRYERWGVEDRMVYADSNEAVAQLRVLCCLWFRAVFHPDRALVEEITRPAGRGLFGSHVPSRYVDRYFDVPVTPAADEVEGFAPFLTHLLALPRATYRRVVTCVRAFADSLEAMNSSHDKAYALMVYLLETLSQGSAAEYQPTWEDYDEVVRRKIDRACGGMPDGPVSDIRSALLGVPHLRLKKRFVEFVAAHVGDSFFTVESTGRPNPVRKSELRRLLGNLYATRSGYVHELRGLSADLRALTISPAQDTFRFQHDAHLTYSGLVRLTRHVLIRFVTTQPTLEREQVDWRRQLPGVIQMHLSPEYWVGNVEGFAASHAVQKYVGVIEHVLPFIRRERDTMMDLRPVMEAVETVLPRAKADEVPALIGLYWLYNGIVPDSHRRPGWEGLVDARVTAETAWRFEYLIVTALFGCPMTADPVAAERGFRSYLADRHKPTRLRVPAVVELAVLAVVANGYLAAGDVANFGRLAGEAATDAPGQPDLQAMLAEAAEASRPIDVYRVLTGRPATLVADSLDYAI